MSKKDSKEIVHIKYSVLHGQMRIYKMHIDETFKILSQFYGYTIFAMLSEL